MIRRIMLPRTVSTSYFGSSWGKRGGDSARWTGFFQPHQARLRFSKSTTSASVVDDLSKAHYMENTLKHQRHRQALPRADMAF